MKTTYFFLVLCTGLLVIGINLGEITKVLEVARVICFSCIGIE